jgi:hypothetical protein
VNTEIKRPRWRFNAAYRLSSRLQAGLEYNPVVGEVLPTTNWILQPETETAPLITLGTSSDRIGTPEGYLSYYVSFAKSWQRVPVAPYLSVSYSEFKRGLEFPFGANIRLARQWDFLAMNDGRHSHLLLTYKQANYNVTLMLNWMKLPGISIGWAF